MAVKKIMWSDPVLVDLGSGTIRGASGCRAGSANAIECQGGSLAGSCPETGTQPDEGVIQP